MLNPLIFGYLRVPDDMSDEEAKNKQDDLNSYAETNGYRLVAVFHEYGTGAQTAFAELIQAVERAEAKHVVVPTYRELALNRSLQEAMLTYLSYVTGAELISLDECS
ncbi:hypothetical protein SZN_16760 [Streptomyces zinciresistens K42]|uniref:Resolvase/invertase-type recombinase catalytic domain-containing protein n=1 Tax=Streptomyces zinciresistens K42 TaxID=700597 RepID=G2GCX5_9ACTN|nr:recombinase family protein [Streptomyces zinciresistens]EGX58638.1 hypothetical protein SZN_16760 [Streptomyces zinciresistens K42]